ncbi:MAG: hypothetical protein ACD_15C00077G0020 [uncultured bacterium]|nr:MAG: hypothetical protein ACD_15C00077G0020 [uncultured bacterium]HCU70919.1 hypothetical protein [Candidatus Moranbacteria bacterium]
MDISKNNRNRTSFWRRRVPFSFVFIFLIILSGIISWYTLNFHEKIVFEFTQPKINPSSGKTSLFPGEKERLEWHFKPGPISMEKIRTNGCVADGFLSGYGEKTKEITQMLNRSNCVYLHRALETWLRRPDFKEAENIMEKVELQPVVYGMFIAEAISTRKKFEDDASGENYHYEKMCREGTEGRWGNETCIPSVSNVEYRRYIKAITRRAMDIGIQSFLFGQIQLQDKDHNFKDTEMKKILEDMRQYAKEKKIQIIIGAQTDDIVDEKYLRMFDYIEGGVGIDAVGRVEDQPCSSNFSSCWALLWDKRYSSKANNVLLHLDWSGLVWDDMGKFARMDKEKRIETIQKLYNKFNGGNTGFLMPFLAVLNKENEGCYGPNKNFYTPSKKYKCKDEDEINKIIPEP